MNPVLCSWNLHSALCIYILTESLLKKSNKNQATLFLILCLPCIVFLNLSLPRMKPSVRTKPSFWWKFLRAKHWMKSTGSATFFFFRFHHKRRLKIFIYCTSIRLMWRQLPRCTRKTSNILSKDLNGDITETFWFIVWSALFLRELHETSSLALL